MSRMDARDRAIEDGVVEFLIRVRSDALRAGVPAMDIYSRIQSRVEAACRQAESAEVWMTKVLRGLQITSPRKDTLSAGRMLVETIESGKSRRTLNRINRRVAYIMARVIERVEEAREKKS